MRHGILVLSLLLIVAVPPAWASDDPDVVVKGAVGRALDRALQEATNGMWWGAVLVAKDGKILLAKGYGYADFANRPTNANTLFEIASASKPITATAVLHLIQDDELGLEDTLGELWPDLPEDKRDITVHQLLTHTSGLSDRIGVPYDSPLEREAWLRHILDAPVATKPDAAFDYNNAGYALLAAIVEKVTGSSFEDYVHEHVFAPAGMERSGFIQDERLRREENVAIRWSPRTASRSAVDWHWGWGYRGMGGVVTTVHDLYRLDRALRGDTILDEETRGMAYTPKLGGYACGWRVGASPSGGRKVEHSGGVQGFTCQYERHLEDDLVIAVLTNQRGNPFQIAQLLRERLVVIRAHLDASPYTLTDSRAAELGDGARWKVEADGPERRLLLVDASDHVAARIDVPAEALRTLVAELERASAARASDDAGDPAAIEAGIYLVNHPGGVIHDLEDGLEIRVLPQYTGRSRDGTVIVDKRATFVLVDTRRGSWPVMVKMNRAATQALLKSLR